jgi:hypothetical protein
MGGGGALDGRPGARSSPIHRDDLGHRRPGA